MWLLVITEGEGPALLRSLVSTVHSLQSTCHTRPCTATGPGDSYLTQDQNSLKILSKGLSFSYMDLT